MKILRKVNRGLLLTILVLIVVAVYVVTLVKEVNGLKAEVVKEATDFFAIHNDCMVIPEDFREDPDGYIAKIGPRLREFFAEEEAYQFYIESNILSQYKNKMFYKDYWFKFGRMNVNSYDQEIINVSLSLQGQKTLQDGSLIGSGGSSDFQYKKVDGAMKIYYLNFGDSEWVYETHRG